MQEVPLAEENITLDKCFQPVRRYALVRMRKPCSADDKHGADEKTLFCCCKRILNNLLLYLITRLFVCKIWYRGKRKIGRHCAHILIVRTCQPKAPTKLSASLFHCYVTMETKYVQLQGKAQLISISLLPLQLHKTNAAIPSVC